MGSGLEMEGNSTSSTLGSGVSSGTSSTVSAPDWSSWSGEGTRGFLLKKPFFLGGAGS